MCCLAPISSRWCSLDVWGLPLSMAAHKLTGNPLFSSGSTVGNLWFWLLGPWGVLRPHNQCLGRLVGLTVACLRWNISPAASGSCHKPKSFSTEKKYSSSHFCQKTVRPAIRTCSGQSWFFVSLGVLKSPRKCLERPDSASTVPTPCPRPSLPIYAVIRRKETSVPQY